MWSGRSGGIGGVGGSGGSKKNYFSTFKFTKFSYSTQQNVGINNSVSKSLKTNTDEFSFSL